MVYKNYVIFISHLACNKCFHAVNEEAVVTVEVPSTFQLTIVYKIMYAKIMC